MDILRWKRTMATLPLTILVLSTLILLLRGVEWGIEFTGGIELRLRTKPAAGVEEVSRVVSALADGVEVQEVVARREEQSQYLVKIGVSDGRIDHIQEQLVGYLARDGIVAEPLSATFVGPSVGQALVRSTLWAVAASVLLILAYVSVRFRIRHGAAAILALVHDTLAVLAAVSLAGVPMSLDVVAAILTVLGYSVNDSIVILDRMREIEGRDRKMAPADRVGLALAECWTRTICLSAATMMSLAAFLVIGPVSLQPFCFALVVGLAAGLVSTVCLVPVLLLDRNPGPRRR